MLPENPQSNNQSIDELLEKFSNSSDRKRRGMLDSLEKRGKELSELGIPSLLSRFDPEGDDWAAGWLLQVLQKNCSESFSDTFLWFKTSSSSDIDYSYLQKSLIQQRYEDADRFTSSTLRKLAGKRAEDRGYVYFSEVDFISGVDLLTLDRLWVAYSQGKFGFSVQAKLLESLSGRYDRLWPRIGWKIDGTWTRYPSSFEWSIKAPEGHMPLINQLRGVRLMDALLRHSALKARR